MSDLEQEKLAALAEFAAGAGHEINNPIAVISGRAQLLLAGETDPQRRRELALIHAQAARVHEMIADLMFFARPPQPNFQTFDLAAALGGLLTELANQAGERQISLLQKGTAKRLDIVADPAQVLAAVRAICLNALFALPNGGRIEVELAPAGEPEFAPADNAAEVAQAAEATPPVTARKGAPDGVSIIVADNGPGIAAEVRRHLFDPYYSGRESGRGLGIGLSKVWRIAQLHGGKVGVRSQPGAGAQFTLWLPLWQQTGESAEA